MEIIIKRRRRKGKIGGYDDICPCHTVGAGGEFVHGLGVVIPGHVKGFDAGVIGEQFARFNRRVGATITNLCNGPDLLDDQAEAVAY
jgi:hypothetical protein